MHAQNALDKNPYSEMSLQNNRNLWGVPVKSLSKGVPPYSVQHIMTSDIGPLRSSHHTTFTLFFTLGYYMGVIPFKPVFESDLGVWKLKGSKLQQVLSFCVIWGIMWFSILDDTQQSVKHFVQGSTLTAKKYFLFIRSFVNDLKLILFLWITIKKTQQIETAINKNADIEESLQREPFGSRALQKSRMYLFVAGGIYAVNSLVNFLFVHHDGAKSETNVMKMFDTYVQDARKRWSITENASVYEKIDWTVGVLEVTMRFTNYHVPQVVEFFFLGILPHVFWLAMMNFQEAINLTSLSASETKQNVLKQKYPYTDFLLDKFDELREFAQSTNDIWANLALIWLIDHSMKFIFSLNDTLSSNDAFNMLTALVRVLLFSGVLVTAAEVYRRVACFTSWLNEFINDPVSENQFILDEDDEYELKMLLKELEILPVGIGSVGVYKFDYAFVSQLLVMIITLFVVSFEK